MNQRNVQILSIAFFLALVGWGAYTFLIYIGTPYHAFNLLNDTGFAKLPEICGDKAVLGMGDYFCRGSVAFFPFLIRTFARMEPFLWYIILSAAMWFGYMFLKRAATQESVLRIRWTPWKVLLMCVALLWLLFTVITWGPGTNEKSLRFLVEPRADTYTVGEEALRELRNDFDEFQRRGCLEPLGETVSGAGAFMFKRSCIQAAFFTRVVPQVLFVLVLLFEFLVLGRGLLSFFRLRRTFSHSLEAILSASLGAAGWIVLLWIFAVARVYVTPVGWALAVLVPAVFYKQVLYWYNRFLHTEWETEHSIFDALPFIVWLLISYTLFGFLSVVRPFPIGWDDLGSYLNRPHLMVSYGQFIFSMSAFEWTYVTSLGYLLFGYNSVVGTTTSMMANWTAGLLALLSVFALARHYLGPRSGYLSALLYYTLPLVGHFSFADMKIDNAVFFFGVLATLLVLMAFLDVHNEDPPAQEQKKPRFTDTQKLLFLAGIFAGFAFSIKITAIMVILTLVAVILGLGIGWPAFIGGIGLSFLVLTWQNAFNLTSILSRVNGYTPSPGIATSFMALCAVVMVGGIGYAWMRRPKAAISALLVVLTFAVGVGVVIAPWMEHNNILWGNVVPRISYNAPNNLSPVFIYKKGWDASQSRGQDIRVLPEDLRVDPENAACVQTGGKEELDRYWGNGDGWGHYLLLPWRTTLNLDSTGYYVTTMAALLLFPLVLLLPYFWTPRGRWLRWLSAATALLVVQWAFVANGVPWYGIGMFLGLVIALEAFVARAPDLFSRAAAAVIIGLSVLTSLGFRMGQFEQQRSMYEYPMGKISGPALREITVANYDDIVRMVQERNQSMPDRPYLYRIGTFIQYFIPKNLEMIGIADHQLDTFNCLFAERDPALTAQRLKGLGFNAFVLDLNTATIEQDPNGTLHKKVELFQNFVNDPRSGAEIVVNDGKNIAYIILK